MSLTTLISSQELAAQLAAQDLLIVDCRFDLTDASRGAQDHRQAHIPGAMYAHLNDDLSDLSKVDLGRHPLPAAASFSATLRRWGWSPRLRVVAYDGAGGALAAARLWWLLRIAGAGDVAVLDGGLKSWQEAELPLDANPVERAASSVEVQFDSSKIIYNSQMYKLREDPATLVLDARAGPRYRGEIEPIDAVAGHIPGSRNRPFSENLQADGRFKPREVLRGELHALLAGHAPDQVIHSCGSGVTACHNLLAFEHAGLLGSRVYAPSWSGWIADSNNPVERG